METTVVFQDRNDCMTPLGAPVVPPVNLMACVSPSSRCTRSGTWPRQAQSSAAILSGPDACGPQAITRVPGVIVLDWPWVLSSNTRMDGSVKSTMRARSWTEARGFSGTQHLPAASVASSANTCCTLLPAQMPTRDPGVGSSAWKAAASASTFCVSSP